MKHSNEEQSKKGQAQSGATGGDRLKRDDEGPAKRHGDALEQGSGTRHGVTEPDERPET